MGSLVDASYLPYFKVKLHKLLIGFDASISAMLPTIGRPGGPGIVSRFAILTFKQKQGEVKRGLKIVSVLMLYAV